MTYDQAQSPRLGQRTPVTSTTVRMFSGGEIPEAAWEGQLIYRNETQTLQIYNGAAWEDVAGGELGVLTYVGPVVPVSQSIGDIWFNTADANRMYVAHSVGSDQITTGEWELVSTAVPPVTSTTYIYRQDTPPTAATVPPPKDNDFWFETPNNHQYYYLTSAPGTHWVSVLDGSIAIAQGTADAKIKTFYQTSPPTSVSIGDIWFDTDDGNKQYRAFAAGVSVVGTTGWVLVQDTSIAAASASAAAANTAASNALTVAQAAQATADGSVTTYYQSNPPWANGATGHANNAGDMWFDIDDGQAYRWNDSTKNWDVIEDSSIGAALGAAQSAQTTADGKITAYYATSQPWANASGTHDLDFGDLWYDTSNLNKPYYWNTSRQWLSIQDGSIAVAKSVADAKTKAFYQDNPPTAITLGDIWYDTDDDNHPYFASAIGVSAIATPPTNGWWDAKDPNIDLLGLAVAQNGSDIEAHSDAILDLGTSVENVSLTVTSVNNSADTADGRVSMSDYQPGPDDLYYDTTRIDPDTMTVVPVSVLRNNGSIWFVRTRPRRNLCTNPSFELNTTFWTTTLASITRVASAFDPAGGFVAQVTNTGSGAHVLTWGDAARVPCSEGQIITASVFAQLVSGGGVGVTIEVMWYAGTTLLTPSVSTPMDLVVNAFDPALAGTIAEPRLWVTGAAPTGATAFSVRVVSPVANTAAVWQVGSMLVELEDDLGRYFDGDSYDGAWDGTTQNSSSYLNGDKITELWELRDGDWIRKYLTNDTLWYIDASKLTGLLDGALINDNTIAPDKLLAAQVQASEALTAGDLVSLWNNNGVYSVQRASAASGTTKEAHGFVLDTVSAGAFVPVYHVGYNPFMTGLAPGPQWLSTSPGKVTRTPPVAAGTIVQRVGNAPTNTVLNFCALQPIRIT